MAFYIILGWFIFWISLILAIVLFSVYKKLFTVFYLVSIAMYIYSAGYMIDIYSFSKLGILITMVVSAILFMVLGYYLSNSISSSRNK